MSHLHNISRLSLKGSIAFPTINKHRSSDNAHGGPTSQHVQQRSLSGTTHAHCTISAEQTIDSIENILRAVSVPGFTQPSTFCKIFLVSFLICTS